ncbi:MAG: molybdopterin-dependent oxidoreductase [Rhizobiales bacterium]|nr:molybdopterin-dependent oxidoreductase [Hyphomicrobiales bacterium]
MKSVSFKLNGTPRQAQVQPEQTLLDVLRETFKVTSVKDACSPQGLCGCCLTLIDGQPKNACMVKADKVAGRSIVTLEGVSDNERKLYADAFQAAAGLQCGFCTPGIVLRTKWLTDQSRPLSRAEIARAIDGHLCRCTGYKNIIDAIELIHAAKHHGGALPAPVLDGRVGSSLQRYQGAELTLGSRPFVADIDAPGLLHGAVVLSHHARALVKRIDVSKALALPGVVAVATAKDVPGNRWVGLIYKDWPCFVAEGEEVRTVADCLAAIAADSMRTARAAAKLVEVEYEVRPAVVDPAEAIKPGVPQVNPMHENILQVTRIDRGDADAALAASAHVVSGTWKTQRIEQLYLEPESTLAVPEADGRLRLYSQGQGIFDDRMQVAAVLGIPESQLFVELVPNGGAFGGREDMTIQAQTALLAHLTKRPVRVTLSREQSIRMHTKRHPITMTYTVGCDAEGRLTALKATLLGDSGAYASVGGKVLERAAGHACGPYRVPAVAIHSTAAYTNNPPCGAMRGFGVNQTSFAMEGCMDLLAAKVGIDGWEMRWRNVLRTGDVFTTGQVLEKGVGVERTLLAGRAAADAAAKLKADLDKGLALADLTGRTYAGEIRIDDTTPLGSTKNGVIKTHTAFGWQTTGSRATLLAGRAAADAAAKLKADLDNGLALADLTGRTYAGEIRIDDTTPLGSTKNGVIKTHTAFGWATQMVVLDSAGAVARVVAAHDVGRAINPQQCEGQVQGAVHMGLGYALTEELPCRDGVPVTFDMRNIGVLRAQHMPEVEVILVEEPEPEGPFGAKGVGEIGLVPTAGAVAAALEAFDGQRRMTLPMKDSSAARAINVGRIPDTDRDQWH